MTTTRFTSLPDASTLKALVSAAVVALKIEEAVIWEGVRMSCSPVPTLLDWVNPNGELEVCRAFRAISVVEHQGDEDGIRESISELKGREVALSVTGMACSTVRIADILSSDIIRGEARGDDDYEVEAMVALRMVFQARG